jgi:hypothetical protein
MSAITSKAEIHWHGPYVCFVSNPDIAPLIRSPHCSGGRWAHELSGDLLSTPRPAIEAIVRRNALFLIAGGDTAARGISGL